MRPPTSDPRLAPPALPPSASDRRPTTTDRPARAGVALAATLIGSTALASNGDACVIAEPDASALVSIEVAPGVDDEIEIVVYEERDAEGRVVGSDCYANISVALSAFPSISNRLATHTVARAIQESAAALGAETCDVRIWYEDTEDQLSLGEECVTAKFGFSSSDHWTSESERSCWTDEALADIEAWEREREAQEALDAEQADAFAAAEDGIEEWGESLDEEAAAAASEEVTLSSVEPNASEDEFLWAGN